MNNVKALIDAVARRAQCLSEEVEWYSWPQAVVGHRGRKGKERKRNETLAT